MASKDAPLPNAHPKLRDELTGANGHIYGTHLACWVTNGAKTHPGKPPPGIKPTKIIQLLTMIIIRNDSLLCTVEILVITPDWLCLGLRTKQLIKIPCTHPVPRRNDRPRIHLGNLFSSMEDTKHIWPPSCTEVKDFMSLCNEGWHILSTKAKEIWLCLRSMDIAFLYTPRTPYDPSMLLVHLDRTLLGFASVTPCPRQGNQGSSKSVIVILPWFQIRSKHTREPHQVFSLVDILKDDFASVLLLRPYAMEKQHE